MKTLFTLLLILVGLSHGQVSTIAGQTAWGDSVRWGDTDDSTGYLRMRGNALAKDSAGTWVTITTDSCSKWIRVERGAQRPIWKSGELQYEVRSSSGQTDSTQAYIGIDSRYCKDPMRAYLGCDTIVRYGRHVGTPDHIITDSLYTVPTVSGVTWLGTEQEFQVTHGNQIRLCVDGYRAGAAAGDTLFFRRFILRFQ